MKGKDIIKLEYVEKGVVYHGEIDKSNFVNQMEHMVNGIRTAMKMHPGSAPCFRQSNIFG